MGGGLAAAASEDGAEDATENLAAESASDGTGGAFGDRFDQGIGLASARARFIPRQAGEWMGGSGGWRLTSGGAKPVGEEAPFLRGWGRGGAGRRGLSRVEFFEGRLAVDDLFVDASDQGFLKGLAAFGVGNGPESAARGADAGLLNDGGLAFFVEAGHEGFADGELGEYGGGIEAGIGSKGFGGGANGFLVLGCESAKGVLDAIAEFAKDGVGNVLGILGDEEDADAFGADEADHLFDLFEQDGGHVIEEEVGFVEEENEFGFGEVADFGEVFEELGEEPEQKGAVDAGSEHEAVGGEHIDDAATGGIGLEEVVEVESRFCEEAIAALLIEGHEATLDGADAGRGDVAIAGGKGGGVFPDVGQEGSQVFEIQKEEAVVIGRLEDDVEDPGLGFIELEEAGEEDGTHFGDRGAYGMAFFAEDIPERDGVGGEGEVLEMQEAGAFLDAGVGQAGSADAGEVAFDVGQEDGDTLGAEGFGEDLEGDGFAGSGCAGDEAVAIGHLGQEENIGLGASDKDGLSLHGAE